MFVLLQACSAPCGRSKEAYLKKVDALVEQAGKLELPLDDEAWKKYDEQFDELVNTCYETWEEELTVKEKQHLLAQIATYGYRRAGGGKFKEWVRQGLKEAAEGFEALQEELQPLIEEIKSDVDEVLKEVEQATDTPD